MKITRKIYLLLVAFVVSQAMAAQTVLTGKVLEKASGEPLAGASVLCRTKMNVLWPACLSMPTASTVSKYPTSKIS